MQVVLIDEIGFHHATSVAELLADRGCSVEIVTPGMVVGQDLGITLDMEQWWIRADAKGIVQSTDLVPMGFDGTHADAAPPPDRRQRAAHARTGSCWPCRRRRPSSCTSTSRPPARPVERVGDCVAPAPGPRRRRRGRPRGASALRPAAQAMRAALPRSLDDGVTGTGGSRPSSTRSTCGRSPTRDGDGIGDLDGLPVPARHIASLGVDAIWLCPIYPSPQRDHGYDVADYFDVDPVYGDLTTFDRLVADAHALGLRS